MDQSTRVHAATTRMPVPGQNTDDAMAVHPSIELLAPRKVINQQDRLIGRQGCEIGVEPIVDSAGNPRKGLAILTRTQPLPLPCLAIVDDQMQGAHAGAVVEGTQGLPVGTGIYAGVVVVVSRRGVHRHGKGVNDVPESGELFRLAPRREIAAGNDEVEIVPLEDPCQVAAEIRWQAPSFCR